jgi:hypothetical protein
MWSETLCDRNALAVFLEELLAPWQWNAFVGCSRRADASHIWTPVFFEFAKPWSHGHGFHLMV